MKRNTISRNTEDRHHRNRSVESSERGFVTVTTAIVLTLLLMCAALALDVAIWFSRGNELQRAADAAALAGVVKMPDEVSARNAAVEIAAKNKISAANVNVSADPNAPRELKVTITDPNVSSFFGRFVSSGIALNRSASAEYVPKIELGSRLNALGTGNLPGWAPSGGTQNFFLAINGKCTAREDGDLYASAFDGNRLVDGTIRCDSVNGLKNLEYRTESATEIGALNQASYTYIVDIPCPTALVAGACTTPIHGRIDAWNPYFDNSNNRAGGVVDTNVVDATVNPALHATAGFETWFRIRDNYGNPVPSFSGVGVELAKTYPTCTNCAIVNNEWSNMFNVNRAGKYRIDVSTVGAAGQAYGSNAFSLRVWTDQTGPALCTTAPCPTIAGQSTMSVYANASGGSTDLYLARLSPARYYRGKKVQVLLFDPGEGARSIQILRADPVTGYQPFPFRYRTTKSGLALGSDVTNASIPDNGIPLSAAVTELPVDEVGTTLSPATRQAPWWGTNPPANDTIYNGRMVSVEVQIPPTYGCVANTIPCVEDPLPEDGWWKIRYNTNADEVSDRTTWSVRMFGDPVHLKND
jgi:hypothetical protein